MHDCQEVSKLPSSILLTGGASCGKSSYAERLAMFGPSERVYIATMPPIDEEGRLRVLRHQKLRQGKGFRTVECYSSLEGVDLGISNGASSVVLLECLTNHIGNLLFEGSIPPEDTLGVAVRGVEDIMAQCSNLIVITNEVGCDLGQYTGITEQYIRILGGVNNSLAARFQAVADFSCGIPFVVKGHLPQHMEGLQ